MLFMTNKIALSLALIIIAIFLADHFLFQWDLHVILGKMLARSTEYIAFWR